MESGIHSCNYSMFAYAALFLRSLLVEGLHMQFTTTLEVG